VIINGAANGGFFSTTPTVVGNVFGSRRVGVAMGMIVSGWAGGYLMVSIFYFYICLIIGYGNMILTENQGIAYRWISSSCLWRPAQHIESVSSGDDIRWLHGTWRFFLSWSGEAYAEQGSFEETVK
jgi:MFS family permease